ncbi:MAG: hypothetical protein IRZ16_03400 [Myxococcaceae bacterium]|nr:hypothetical protein [Myxococcaceae bacterium]
MRLLPFAVAPLILALASLPAHAQADALFGDGNAPIFKEEEQDHRFAKSHLARALEHGTEDPNCAQVLAGLLTLLGEAAPYFHKRDQNFYLDATLANAMNVQLNNPRFPGTQYFVSMVRRVLIDGRLPPAWLQVARALNAEGAKIDIAKLEYLADGVKPIESFYFTFPKLKERYDVEVVRATTAAKSTALLAFRDAYLDREVAWNGLTLVDIGPPPKKKGKHAGAAIPKDALVARLEWQDPNVRDDQLDIFGKLKKLKPVRFEAVLAPEQYVDLQRIPKGTRLMVRGRFWEMNDDLTKIELRNALVFGERDFSQGVLLADPNAVAMCPFATNDLAGIAPVQPGGFGMHPGTKHR